MLGRVEQITLAWRVMTEMPRSSLSTRVGRPGLILGCVAGAAVAITLFWPVSDWIAAHDVPNRADLTPQQRADALRQARDAARGRLLQLGGGVLAAGALFYTGRNFNLNRRQNEFNRQSLELTREQLREQAEANRRTQELIEEGQVTERYTRAIEQLGSSTVDVRLGGIYAMERIAIDSPRDSSPIGEVLLAFTRDHISDSRPRPTKGADADPSTKNDMSPLRADVRAAMEVLSRAEKSRKWRVSLSDMDISYLDMPIASLQRALLGSTKFVGSNLAHANLRDADATEADFTDADLTDADLQGTSLGGACFIRATLVGAMFRETDLEGADLTDSNLTGAFLNDVVLTEANLTDADLTGVDLSHADLEGADLTGATVDQGASLPSGWNRDPAKGVVVSDDGT